MVNYYKTAKKQGLESTKRKKVKNKKMSLSFAFCLELARIAWESSVDMKTVVVSQQVTSLHISLITFSTIKSFCLLKNRSQIFCRFFVSTLNIVIVTLQVWFRAQYFATFSTLELCITHHWMVKYTLLCNNFQDFYC